MQKYRKNDIIYLPGLNGLRAIAAIAVVISHITLGLGEFGLNDKIFGTNIDGNAKGSNLAGFGVTIFFTLSGFLITFLLLKEKAIAPFKIKEFYIRRILRIWPLYYLYFLICIITILIYGFELNKTSAAFYIFLSANIPFILGNTLPFLAHYWSLGVEEQFYLIFPQLGKFSNKKLLKISTILIMALLLIKFIFWILYKKYNITMPYLAITVTRFHTMFIGVVGAIFFYYKHRVFFKICTNHFVQILSWSIIVLISINRFHIASILDGEIVSIITLFLIIGQITKKNKFIDLDKPFWNFIGKISFGIYVIHPLLIFFCSKVLGKFRSPALINYIFLYALISSATIVLAYLSYTYFEKPFLKLKSKYSVVNTTNTK